MANAYDWHTVEQLFGQAIELPSDSRLAFLQRATKGDTQLIEEVMTLLNQEESAAHFFDRLGENLSDPEEASPLQIGDRLGPYVIVSKLGMGGMSVVYLAERQDKAYQEKVAIKVLKKGLDTFHILRRFRYEQQLLVQLRHPNISTILDGGETPSGQPYLVMEYIQGQPLVEAIQRQDADITRRLEIFLQVLGAVQFAHQRLVVHRDLKPSNILLNSQGQVKLLDFGIAKLLGPLSEEESLAITHSTHRLFTPQYVAPEQLNGGPITTATDVYQLGVLLAEVLTGQRPASGSDSSLSSLPRELQDIIRYAIREEPERRYQGAEAMALDIRAYLTQRPIKARRESLGYLAQKFVRRNRNLVILGVLLLLAMVAGTGISLVQANRAKASLQTAYSEREKAQAMINFLVDLFRRPDPYVNQDSLPAKDMTLQTFLDQSIPSIREDLKDQPEVQLELLATMSKLYNNLSMKQVSYELAKEILDSTSSHFGTTHPKYAEGIHHLAGAALDIDYFEEADSLFPIAISANQQAYGMAPRRLAVVYNDYGLLVYSLGDYPKADSLYQKAIEIMEYNGISDTANYSQTLANRIQVLLSLGQVEEAGQLCHQSLSVLKAAGLDKSIFMAHTRLQYANFLTKVDSLDKAIAQAKQAQTAFETLIGPVSHFVSLSVSIQGLAYRRQEEWGEAGRLLKQNVKLLEQLYGTHNYNYGINNLNLSTILLHTGPLEEIFPYLDTAQSIFEDYQLIGLLGYTHLLRAQVYQGLGKMEAYKSEIDKVLPIKDQFPDYHFLHQKWAQYEE